MRTERLLEIAKAIKGFGVELQSEDNKYIYAFDPTINKRCVHLRVGDYAISMITSHRFRLSKKYLDGDYKPSLRGQSDSKQSGDVENE